MHPLLRIILWACLILPVKIATAQCPAAEPLKIETVITTESRCQSSGMATVQVSGGVAPFTYAIITGPATAPPQSANTFEALRNGHYTVQVTDNCNNTSTQAFTIIGNYTTPGVSEMLTSPSCQNSTDGAIAVQVTGGRAPFSYSLITPSPIIVSDQAGNLFSNLSPGVYTYRVQDSCGNFQTRTVTLLENTNNTFSIANMKLQWVACDSFYYAYRITSHAAASFNAPFRAELKLPNGVVITHIFNTPTVVMNDTFWFRYKNIVSIYPSLILTVFNACGTSKSVSTYMYPNMTIDRASVGGCSKEYNYTFDLGRDNNPGYPYPIPVHCSTITYTLVNPAGIAVASQINNSTFSGFPAGTGYKVIREDCCAKDSITFNWEEIPNLQLGYAPAASCKEGTAAAQIVNTSKVPGDLVVASGPASLAFADGSVHNYTYPDTLKNLFGNVSVINLGYLTAGTYKIYYADTCGQKDTMDIVIAPSMLKRVTFTVNPVKGCVNNNKIIYNGTNNPSGADDITITRGVNTTTRPVGQTTFKDSLVNLQPGSYTATYNYKANKPGYFLQGMTGIDCDIIAHNINIPTYQQPWFNQETAIGLCGTDRIVTLIPDSSRGVLPFEYEVKSGPVTVPIQSNPAFYNLPLGTYTIQMTDACGNSYSNNVAIDTLVNPGLQLITDCQFNYVWAEARANPYYSYSWQYPNGVNTTDPYLYIDPFTLADTGYYKLIVTSNVNGCMAVKDTTIRLDLCMVLAADTVTRRRNMADAGVHKWKLWVYPVPAPRQQPVQVRYPPAAGNARLQVMDLNGKVVLQQTVGHRSTQTNIDMNKLPAGTYLLIYRNDTQRQIIKIVLQ